MICQQIEQKSKRLFFYFFLLTVKLYLARILKLEKFKFLILTIFNLILTKRELSILNSTKKIFQLDTISSCSEPEDGEISTSDESSEDDIDDKDDFERNVESVSSLNLPTPCIRIVVTESSDDATLAVGKLLIVTCTGQLKKWDFKNKPNNQLELLFKYRLF